MALSLTSIDNENMEADTKKCEESEANMECAVCLQTCVLPTRLPCGHIFCFLCAKGLALQSQRCAMCRGEIPKEFLDHPEVIEAKPSQSKENNIATTHETESKTFAWFYEGRNGWWQYETRLSAEVEAAYQRGERTHDAMIAGSIYTLDFDNWMQSKRDDPSRRRRIKRDRTTSQHQGIAGLRQFGTKPGAAAKRGFDSSRDDSRGPQSRAQRVHAQTQRRQVVRIWMGRPSTYCTGRIRVRTGTHRVIDVELSDSDESSSEDFYGLSTGESSSDEHETY